MTSFQTLKTVVLLVTFSLNSATSFGQTAVQSRVAKEQANLREKMGLSVLEHVGSNPRYKGPRGNQLFLQDVETGLKKFGEKIRKMSEENAEQEYAKFMDRARSSDNQRLLEVTRGLESGNLTAQEKLVAVLKEYQLDLRESTEEALHHAGSVEKMISSEKTKLMTKIGYPWPFGNSTADIVSTVIIVSLLAALAFDSIIVFWWAFMIFGTVGIIWGIVAEKGAFGMHWGNCDYWNCSGVH